MTCFPLDDTLYEAKDMGAYLATRTRGVFSADGNLAVTPGDSGLSVLVSPGLAWLRWSEFWGACALQEQTLTINLDAADGVLQRIDAIVCRLDKVNNCAEIVAKKGAFASDPIIESPVRNDNFDEIYLATVRVRAGAIKINGTDITDQRLNEAYCGLMRDGVTGIPTAQLHAQWNAFFADVQQDAIDRQQQADKAFAAWFDHIKELWAEDPAGSMQAQINELQEKKADAETVTEALANKADTSAVNDALAGKAASSHTHDDRYYTEAETNNLLSGKAASSHTHDERYYTKTQTNTAINAGKVAISDELAVRNPDWSQPWTSAILPLFLDDSRTQIRIRGLRDIGTSNQTSVPVTVSHADSAGSAVDQTARDSASSAKTAADAAKTTANAAMPKAGGSFTGNVIAYNTNRSNVCLRNIWVSKADGQTAVSTAYIICLRK